MADPGIVVLTADDTTGALETAAACADAGWSAVVCTTPAIAAAAAIAADAAQRDHRPALVVVDLRSRHLPGDEAAARWREAMSAESLPAGTRVRGHKIDSTLRGNWPDEVDAIAHASHPVLMVPAFPAAGRTCTGGTVAVDGVPVHLSSFAHDPRSPVTSSRPAARLHAAVEAHDLAQARTAFADGARIVVADATTDTDVAALAGLAVAHPSVVVAGPAAILAAVVGLLGPAADARAPVQTAAHPGRVLAVSASRHPVAVAQLESLARRGVDVLRPPADARIDDADAVLAALGVRARQRLSSDVTITTLVVIGGDTAAAVVGGATVEVDGTLGVGIAVGTVELGGRTLRIVAKPGGFGKAETLVDVLLEPSPT